MTSCDQRGRGISLSRRHFLQGTAALGASASATPLIGAPALAAAKPDKIVVTGLKINWNRTFEQEIAPLFENKTGIKVQFEWLPIDALAARLKTQLSASDGGIDVAWFNTGNVNAMASGLADHTALFKEFGAPDGYDFEDIFLSSRLGYTVGGRLVGIPFRYTTYIQHYQPDILEKAGISKAPSTFADYRQAGLAVTEKFGPERFGIGMYGRESEAMVRGWHPFLLSSGGRYYDPKTWDILINKPEAVSSLQFYGGLAKDKVVPPEYSTWEWDGLTAGAQADRYAMTVTIGPYATLMGDPAKSKTAGKWAWAKVPGATDPSQATASAGGWAMGVSENSKNKRWAFEFLKMATSKAAMKSTTRDGNAPPRNSVLNDPDVVKALGWAPAFSEMAKVSIAFPTADDPVFTVCDQQIRPHISRVLLGQATAQEAMDAAAAEWKRTLRRAGLI
ncbi:ABC transporter substrate-binding protein [Chelatococcus asaccharovorans]|uniref:ABC transporter substrate-binding protein n=1 Tax=Chelatococcus asaccharovorans TaxID=28210 RepID=UPI00224C6A17|nr:extracellular solute-binding protein [Chelatococcus asaccharovorans]CAH1651512.1 Carbohydrate ABC transporter substrate-binding protein (CUT1 family) [Chelatococcus asaccharovorans]CAH1692963.1 Carbohydrate ABC transporter substrate-binding protein (CUT1 family) [Chelatococcus asaccharovorans]